MAIAAGNTLGFSEEGDEQKQNEVGVDLGLQLEISRKIFRSNLACAALELKRGVERVIDLFHERDERANVLIAEAGTGVVLLELFDQPAGIINPNVKAIVGRAEKCARELAQFARTFAG